MEDEPAAAVVKDEESKPSESQDSTGQTANRPDDERMSRKREWSDSQSAAFPLKQRPEDEPYFNDDDVLLSWCKLTIELFVLGLREQIS